MVQIIIKICIIIILYMATGHILTCIWRNVFTQDMVISKLNDMPFHPHRTATKGEREILLDSFRTKHIIMLYSIPSFKRNFTFQNDSAKLNKVKISTYLTSQLHCNITMVAIIINYPDYLTQLLIFLHLEKPQFPPQCEKNVLIC